MKDTPNLNDLKTRLLYVLNGGKVRLASWPKGEFIEFSAGRFRDEKGAVNGVLALNSLDHTDWEPYIEPKTHEQLREEFAVSTLALDHMDLMELVYDTFEPRKK